MKKWTLLLLLATAVILSCNRAAYDEAPLPDWSAHKATPAMLAGLDTGRTYLSVYSSIYSLSEHKTHDLTATVSMRNVHPTDTVYLTQADYFNTDGDLVKHYLQFPILIEPLETLEIVINERDRTGGTGATFIVHWSADSTIPPPYFEAVMISTPGSQGLSFTTKGVPIPNEE